MTAVVGGDWAFWSIGAVFVLGGGTFVIWALWRDQARGTRRCPKCWYEMMGVRGLRCPECGREVRHERALLRPRRRWRLAVLGMCVVGLGAAQVAYPAVRREGVLSFVPTWILIAALPHVDNEWRIDATTGAWTAHPVAQEICRRCRALTPGEWSRLLRRSAAVEARISSPQSRVLVVSMSLPAWVGPFCRITATPVAPGLKEASAGRIYPGCGLGRMAEEQARARQELGVLPAGATSVTFRITVQRGTGDFNPDARVQIDAGEITVAVRGS